MGGGIAGGTLYGKESGAVKVSIGGGCPPLCMPGGMPEEPKMSHFGSSLPSFASGIFWTVNL